MNDIRQLFIGQDGAINELKAYRGYALHNIGTWTNADDETVFHIEIDGDGSRVLIDMCKDHVDYVVQESRGNECAIDRDGIIAALDRISKANARTAAALEHITNNGINTCAYVSHDYS